jgi:putative FmdB family regulatory protein
VPVYEYRCLECDEIFDQRASVDQADAACCPAGHSQVRRLLSVFAGGRRATQPTGTGGCCGGACGCG